MKGAGALRTIVICLVLIVLHYTLRPLLGWRAGVDFLLMALLVGSVRMRPGLAALYGFVLGLIADSLALSAFGAGALSMTLIGFGASRLKAVFFADNLALNGFFLFLGKWLFDVLFLIIERRLGGAELAMQVFVWSALAAAVTALVGVLVLALLRPMLDSKS